MGDNTGHNTEKSTKEHKEHKEHREHKEHKHKHKHKHKSHDHDKEKHKSSHHDKEKHKSHHHDKEKHKSHHDKPHKPKVPGPGFPKMGSSIFTSAPVDISSRLLAEPIDREIDGNNFQIVDHKSSKDGILVSPPKKKRKKTAHADGECFAHCLPRHCSI